MRRCLTTPLSDFETNPKGFMQWGLTEHLFSTPCYKSSFTCSSATAGFLVTVELLGNSDISGSV